MTIKGKVIPGEGKAGRYYKTPTANLSVAPAGLAKGVYAGFATLDGATWPSVICWGEKFEAHLFGYDGDLYGKEVTVEIKEKVSDLESFKGEAQMRRKIESDVARAKAILNV